MEIQLIHKAELMEPDGFDGDVEQHRHLLRSTVLRNQLQHFSLTRGRTMSLRRLSVRSIQADRWHMFSDEGNHWSVAIRHNP